MMSDRPSAKQRERVHEIVDSILDLYHPKAKIAKDVGAGAVVIAAINAVIVAYFLFFDKLSQFY